MPSLTKFTIASFVLTFLFLFVSIRADQGFYDTDAIYRPDKLKDLTGRPTAKCTFKTSTVYLAETEDLIRVWLKGDFASSGPHTIGPFERGEQVTVDITLDREIGRITHYFLQKDGFETSPGICSRW